MNYNSTRIFICTTTPDEVYHQHPKKYCACYRMGFCTWGEGDVESDVKCDAVEYVPKKRGKR
jgi:hypothetical protein